MPANPYTPAVPAAPAPAAAFGTAVPPNLKCGFCRTAIDRVFFRTLNQFACPNCASQVQDAIAKNRLNAILFLRSAAAGVGVAIACAIAWAAIVFATHTEIGIVASFIGVAVGKTIQFAAGKRRGRSIQIVAAVISVLGMILGKVFLIGAEVIQQLQANNHSINPLKVVLITLVITVTHPEQVFEVFDFVWGGIAAWAAWRLCKAPTITVAGPFAYQPTPQPAMQFDTVEPLNPPAREAPQPEQS